MEIDFEKTLKKLEDSTDQVKELREENFRLKETLK